MKMQTNYNQRLALPVDKPSVNDRLRKRNWESVEHLWRGCCDKAIKSEEDYNGERSNVWKYEFQIAEGRRDDPARTC